MRTIYRLGLCFLLALGSFAGAGWCQAAGQRLILKDGSYQIGTRYAVPGARGRYQRAERGNEWE